MKIHYTNSVDQRIKLNAPREVITAIDAELTIIMDNHDGCHRFPHLKELWYNTIGDDEEISEDPWRDGFDEQREYGEC